jgi:hypothetical protein
MDLIAAYLTAVGVPAARAIVFGLIICLLLSSPLFRVGKKAAKGFFLILVVIFGTIEVLVVKPTAEYASAIYPILFAFVYVFSAPNYSLNSKGSRFTLVLFYVLGSLVVDLALEWRLIPDFIVRYYAEIRKFNIDEDFLLPGIGYRRFFPQLVQHRFSGLVLDPLAHGIILIICSWQLLSKNSSRFFALLVIFFFTESRAAVLFWLLLFLFSQIDLRRNKRLLGTALPSLYILLLLFMSGTRLEGDVDSHSSGLLGAFFNVEVLFGLGQVWLTPEYVENGFIFLCSGFGLFGVAYWFWLYNDGFHKIYENDLGGYYKIILALCVMLPVHYYLFNFKIYIFALVACSFCNLQSELEQKKIVRRSSHRLFAK